MLDIILVIFVIVMIVSYYRAIKKMREQQVYDPFNRYQPVSQFKCTNEECKTVVVKPHERFEYMLQKKGKCPKCKSRMIIEGIYYDKIKTKRELKWEKEMEKWR